MSYLSYDQMPDHLYRVVGAVGRKRITREYGFPQCEFPVYGVRLPSGEIDFLAECESAKDAYQYARRYARRSEFNCLQYMRAL